MKRKPSCCPGTDETIVRSFHIEDFDAVIALWRRAKGVGLNESDTRRAITAFLRRNPNFSFVAEKAGRIVGAVLCGHDGRRGYLHHLFKMGDNLYFRLATIHNLRFMTELTERIRVRDLGGITTEAQRA